VTTPVTTTTVTTPTTTTGACTDTGVETATQCASWKASGFCNNNYVKANCGGTCGSCNINVVVNSVTAVPVTAAPTPAPTVGAIEGVCVNFHADAAECANWVGLGYCTFPAWSTWMNQMCNKACLKCDDFRCRNVEPVASCLTSVATGSCTSAEWGAWMGINCKLACGLCQPRGQTGTDCSALTHTQLKIALSIVTCGEPECKGPIPATIANGAATNGHYWASYLNRAGTVCSVVSSTDLRNSKSPFGRSEALSKANTANSFSTDTFPMSSANLYGYAMPGGSLYGSGAAAPFTSKAANSLDMVSTYGFPCGLGVTSDPACGVKVGGFVPSGGGLALYDKDGVIVGAIGVGGADACVSHNVAWKVRKLIGMAPAGTVDNIKYATAVGAELSNTNQHPSCSAAAQAISDAFV
jgi:hypothetical protein